MASAGHAAASESLSQEAGPGQASAKWMDRAIEKATWFKWSSTCPKTTAIGKEALHVKIKSMQKQSLINPETAVVTETLVFLEWKKETSLRGAHAWFYRALKDVNFKGGEGVWAVEPSNPPPRGHAPSTAVATGPAAAVALGPAAVATGPSAFPNHLVLKMFRGMGSGTCCRFQVFFRTLDLRVPTRKPHWT